MAASIKEHGLLNPILVRPLNRQQTSYEIVAGERRWRGAQIAKLHEVPVIVRNFDDEKDPNILDLEEELTNTLGLKVTLKNSTKNNGCLQIHYNNLDQLEPVLDRLRWKPK